MGIFSKRSTEKEWMDDLDCGGEELSQTLDELKTINKWLGGNYVTTSGIAKLVKLKPQESYTVADIGCGGGDMIKVMVDWSRNQKKGFKFIGIDANRNIIDFALVRLSSLSNITFEVQNVFETDFSDHKVDITTCTLFTHHFTDQELIDLIISLREKSRLGIVINDLHRHWFAYYSIKVLTKLFSKSKMVQNDAPLSVLRSFSKRDWEKILSSAQLKNYEISWHWAFRWQVLILL